MKRTPCDNVNAHWFAGVHLDDATPDNQNAGVLYCPTCLGFGDVA